MKIIFNIIIPFITAMFNRREVKEMVVTLLERYAESTGNDIDNKIVAMVRDALLEVNNG